MSLIREREYDVLRHVETFADGRLPIEHIYHNAEKLLSAGWRREVICTVPDGQLLQPVYAYYSHPNDGQPRQTMYILTGIHGEEPAPVNALSLEMEWLIQMAKKSHIPMVVVPLFNPPGYRNNTRYPDGGSDWRTGQSVSACDDYLYGLIESKYPTQLNNTFGLQVGDWVVRTSKYAVPYAVFDLHEDLDEEPIPTRLISYSYLHGLAQFRGLAQRLTRFLSLGEEDHRFEGKTRFEEEIKDCVVFNPKDLSVDDLFSFPKYVDPKTGEIYEKFPCPFVFVGETPIYADRSKTPLEWRVQRYRRLIHVLPKAFNQVVRMVA